MPASVRRRARKHSSDHTSPSLPLSSSFDDSPERKQRHQERGVMAPLRVPLSRRLETASVFLWLLMLPVATAIVSWSALSTVTAIVALPYLGDTVPYASFLIVAFTIWAMCLGAYAAHVFIFDRRWRRDGARFPFITESWLMRRLSRHFRRYFPASCVFDHDDETLGNDQLWVEKYLLNDPSDFSRGDLRRRKPANALPGGAKEPHRHRSLLFCCHPHGLFSFGVWCTFVAPDGRFDKYVRQRQNGCPSQRGSLRSPKLNNRSELEDDDDTDMEDAGSAGRFDEHSPAGTDGAARQVSTSTRRAFDITAHTMSMNFYFPIWREFLMYLGFMDVDRKMFIRRLSPRDAELYQEEPPVIRCSALVPGGAAESVDCTREVLTLKTRQGFVRVAMETGASLVPCYTFGETKLYRPLLNPSLTHRIVRRLQKLVGLGMPLVCGRGVFNYYLGALPHRHAIVTVIGKPIEVERKSSFTKEEVSAVHAKYLEAVRDLYRRNVAKYGPPDAKPEIEFR